jgi:putative Ca2+/H+ antiporter (TMEM165/GDT1 family)
MLAGCRLSTLLGVGSEVGDGAVLMAAAFRTRHQRNVIAEPIESVMVIRHAVSSVELPWQTA